jgi:hypothetical protein
MGPSEDDPMTGVPRSAHRRADDLLQYFEGQLPDGEQQNIEEHLAECESCAVLARTVGAFHEAWQTTAEQHGVLYRREQLIRGLEAAEVGAPALRDRLRAWRDRWAGLAEAGLRVAVESSATTAQVIAQGVEALTRPSGTWHFLPAAAAPVARGAVRGESASALLATASDRAGRLARVAVRGGQSTELEARIDGLAPDAPPPIVIVIAVEAGDVARAWAVQAERRPGADYRIARFRDLPPGEYVVAFEPLAVPHP